MAKSSKIHVMISSRCDSTFPGTTTKLSKIRKELKNEIEKMEIAERKAFEVWINEETPPQGGTWNSWDTCMQAVKDCDILIAIHSGDAGWPKGGLGVCHEELMTGISTAPAKVRLLSIKVPAGKLPKDQTNKNFQEYVQRINLFSPPDDTIDGLKNSVKKALFDSVLRLTQSGVKDASRGKFHSGEALDWSRLNFEDRQNVMRDTLCNELLIRPRSKETSGKIFINMMGKEILVEPHAIPAGLSVSAAREMVGQPFLRDHLSAKILGDKRGGPVHVIACHKTATEGQATKLLGFPDATFVTAPFGIFAADPIQKVQFVFIANCRDGTSTRAGLQRFLTWLNEAEEEKLLVERALARARIIKTIAAEYK